MKKYLIVFSIISIFFLFLIKEKISNFIYYKTVSSKIEKIGESYLEILKKKRKIIYEVFKSIDESKPPEWEKFKKISEKSGFDGFILITDFERKPLRWFGDVKEFNFRRGFRSVFSTDGTYLLLAERLSFGNIYISSKMPEIEGSLFLKSLYFSPPEYFFPRPEESKPPVYSLLYKEEGPPIVGITLNAIDLKDFQGLFEKYLKAFLGIYLIILLFFLKVKYFIKIILLRIFLLFISFELFPFFNEFLKEEYFCFPLFSPFTKNPLELFLTSCGIFLIFLKIKKKFSPKLSIFIFIISSLLYLIILRQLIYSANQLHFSILFISSIFLFSSSFIFFWINNLEFKNLKYLIIFLIPLLILPYSYLPFLFLILGTMGILSFNKKNFCFFILLAFWSLLPPYIFQKYNLKNYVLEAFIYEKLNEPTLTIIRINNALNDILMKWDWEEKYPFIYLIEDKRNISKIFEEKLSLNDLPIEYKIEIFENNELISLSQSKYFKPCISFEKEGILSEGGGIYHLRYPLYYGDKIWGNILMHINLQSPFSSRKDVLPAGFGVYGEDQILQNSNSIFLPERLDEKKLKAGLNFIYQEGNKYYLTSIPPWEFSFPYLIFGALMVLSALTSVSFPINIKSIYFLLLFPLVLILIFILIMAFFFTLEQRETLTDYQTIWSDAVQRNLLDFIEGFKGSFYYKEGILQGGEILKEDLYLCPYNIISSLPLEKPKLFEIKGEMYLFFEDKENNLIGIKQQNLPGIENVLRWFTERTWGIITIIYGFCLILIVFFLEKFLVPINKLSKMAKEVERGNSFQDVHPIFGKELEDLSIALKNSFLKLQKEEKTLKDVLNNLPIGVGFFEGNILKISNPLLPLKLEEILNLKEEGIFELKEKIYQYKKLKIDEIRWIYFSNDITTEIEKEKLSLISNMARIVAHEIKNPLTPIKLSIEYLKEISQKKKEEFLKEFPKISDEILESLKDLESISSEFSDFTRLPSLKKEYVNLKSLLLDLLSPFISKGKIIFSLPEDDVFLNLDPRLFKRALINLLNNAFESSEPSPKVYLNLKKEDKIKIEIIDEGPGVSEEVLDKLFEPYFTTKTSGTGLGLFISKKIIEEHRGNIFAENTEDKGLKITIILAY